MPHLSLQLFGSFHTTLDGKSVGSFGSFRAQGLLAYLALRCDYPHSRGSLATLLWPDHDQRSASRNLRQTLYLLNKGIDNAQQPMPFLLNHGHLLQFNAASDCSVDVLVFRKNLRQRRFAEALDLYSDDLLAGFDCGSTEFDTWVATEREHCYHQALHACRALGEEALSADEPEAAIVAAQRLLALEPWSETGHRIMMCALAANGDHADAMRQYRRCQQVLRQELGTTPSPETEAMYASIVAGTFSLASSFKSQWSGQARADYIEIEVPVSQNRVFDDEGVPPSLNWIVAEEQQTADETVPGEGLIIPLPPPAAPVPEIPGFVGRRDEIAFYTARLKADGLAVIRGMAGVGKTALAATLCRRLMADQNLISWHAFHVDAGIETILWKLAAFLAHHDETTLWTLLESTRLTVGKPPPLDIMVDYVIQAAGKVNFLLCLDDFQHVDADPVLNQLVTRLIQEAKDGTMAGVIITSRRTPTFVQATDFTPLSGLTEEDGRLLARQIGLTLTTDQLQMLYARTAGNAVFLTMALESLARTDHVDGTLTRIVEIEDVEAYLLREVFDSLSAAERAVMAAVSTRLGHPCTRDLIEELVGEGVYHAVQRLVRRHMLTVQRNVQVRTYRQHDIVRTFYYRNMSRQQRQRLHRKTASYFVDHADWINAALHYSSAGDKQQAAALLVPQYRALLSRGESEPLRILFASFLGSLDDQETIWRIHLSLGELHALAGNVDEAKHFYHDLLNDLHEQSHDVTQQVLRAEAYRGLGKAQYGSDPTVAIQWMERALEAIRDLNRTVKAEILIDLGSIMLITGAYRDAIEVLETGLELTTAKQSHLHLHGLSELASVYLWTGEGERSQVILKDALTLARNLGDVINEQALLLNQGILYSQFGDLLGARRCLEDALDSALAFGNAHAAVIALITLGVVHMRVGDYSQSETYLLRAKEVAASHNHAVGEVMVLNNQGEWSLKQGDFEAALAYTREAHDKATCLGLQQGKGYVLDTMAQAYCGMGRHEEALSAVEEALAIAERVADEQIKAFVIGTHGAVLIAMGDVQEGERLIRRSMALSEGVDLQGVAKGKMMLGEMLIARGEIEEGVELVRAAQRSYPQMGATHFADIAARILAEPGLDGFAIPEARRHRRQDGSDPRENLSG